jgi:cytoskeletal protein CcmA (bactofilin family)
MFSKASNKSIANTIVPSGANKNLTPSILSANLRITGNLSTDGVIQLDGIVDGDVKSEDLTLGESAVVTGSIVGNRVRVSGTVNGKISARLVELTRTAKVTGDINHTSLMIEAGAYVQGLCRHVEIGETKTVPKLTESAKSDRVSTAQPATQAAKAAEPIMREVNAAGVKKA